MGDSYALVDQVTIMHDRNVQWLQTTANMTPERAACQKQRDMRLPSGRREKQTGRAESTEGGNDGGGRPASV